LILAARRGITPHWLHHHSWQENSTMYGLSGVVAICSGLAKGESLAELQLSEMPNMPFLYWLAVASSLVKPRWTDDKAWPALKVCARRAALVVAALSHLHRMATRSASPPAGVTGLLQVSMTTPTPISAARLRTFRQLAGWPAAGGGSVPGMFLMAESFKLVMQVAPAMRGGGGITCCWRRREHAGVGTQVKVCTPRPGCVLRCPQVLTLPAFPVSVLGTVVNKRAKYSYLRLVQDSEALTYRCASRTVRAGVSPHLGGLLSARAAQAVAPSSPHHVRVCRACRISRPLQLLAQPGRA
jgi:hypothetical protein